MSEDYSATWLEYSQALISPAKLLENKIYDAHAEQLRRNIYEEALRQRPLDQYVPGSLRRPFKDNKSLFGHPATPIKTESNKQEKTVYPKTDQQIIDDEVREAIEKPRREAEVAKRVAAVTALAALENAEDGTIIRFRRRFGGKNGRVYNYAALLVTAKRDGENEVWYLTGNYSSDRAGYTFEQLLSWMTTGENLVEDVQVATSFDSITWTPADTTVVTDTKTAAA